jgi:retinol dehydrogenase-12
VIGKLSFLHSLSITKSLNTVRYNVSKMIQLLLMRELAAEITKSNKPGTIITSIINPGFVDTSIMRHAGRVFALFVSGLKKLMSRTAEEGGRTLVWAAYGGEETHGKYLDDCVVGKVSPFVVSEDGMNTQKKLWAELGEKLERIEPGILMGI